MALSIRLRWLVILVTVAVVPVSLPAQKGTRKGSTTITFPPALPDGKEIVTDRSGDFLKAPARLKEGVTVARIAPTVDFLFYPGQTYEGKPWSNWGDSLAVNGKYYASIGDHKAPAGNAFVFEYDPGTKKLRQLVDVKKLLRLPEGDYTPGKIHGRLDLGDDGWLYFSTHRGSSRATTDQYHYKGDWIIRHHPGTGPRSGWQRTASAHTTSSRLAGSMSSPSRMTLGIKTPARE